VYTGVHCIYCAPDFCSVTITLASLECMIYYHTLDGVALETSCVELKETENFMGENSPQEIPID